MSTTADTFRPRGAALSNAATVTWRNLLGYVRVPQAIFFASLLPQFVPQGAATSVWAATAPELDAQGGAYLEDCGVARSNPDPASRGGIKPYAIDPARATALWGRTEEWIAAAEKA